MIREWMSQKVSKIRQKFDHHEPSSTAEQKNYGPKRTIDGHSSLFMQLLIQERMTLYYYRHNLMDVEGDVEPCSICFIRYATVKCDPCTTHGRICKYCAYGMLSIAVAKFALGYTETEAVICTICYKPITGFIRKGLSRRVFHPEPIKQKNMDKSVSFHDYAWSLVDDSMKGYHVNEGYDYSNM